LINQEIQVTLPESVISQLATLSKQDNLIIQECRGQHNRLGFAYQLMFTKIFNRLPRQIPMEIHPQIITFAVLQLTIKAELITLYQKRQQTISEHQLQIRKYLELNNFDKAAIDQVSKFIFTEAQRIEHTSILLIKVEKFLKENLILMPARDTLARLIIKQRQKAKARQFIYDTMLSNLTEEQCASLDGLLKADESRLSPLQHLKQPPAQPSPNALITLTKKLELIQTIGLSTLDMDWLNNNYQRSLTKCVVRVVRPNV